MIAQIVTQGYGAWSQIPLVVTRGYFIGEPGAKWTPQPRDTSDWTEQPRASTIWTTQPRDT